MVYYLYACVLGATGVTVNKYTMAGVLLWASKVIEADEEYQVASGICTDPDEAVYVCGAFWDGATVYQAAKFNAAGTLVWKAVVTDTFNEPAGIAVLPNGNVIVATDRWDDSGTYSTLTLLAAATGLPVWNYDSGADDAPVVVAADSDGNIIYASGTYLTLLDGSHTEVWQVAHGLDGAPWSIVVGDGIVFLDGHKFSLVDGAEITAGYWPFVYPVVATDDAENVYIAAYDPGYLALLCMSADLSVMVWASDLWAEAEGPVAAQAFAVCRANRLFICHRVLGEASGMIHAYDASTGVEITDGWPVDTGAYTDYIAAGPGLIGAYPDDWGGMLPPPSITVGNVLYE
jgi:hypothetical protein